jgi:hypothetical protein
MHPWNATLSNTIQHALKARKEVASARLSLDSAKTRLKNARPEKLGVAQSDLQQCEDVFNVAVHDAMVKMRSVVDSVCSFD